jgi:hypothetical protein
MIVFLHQNVIEPSFQNNIGEMTNVLDLILTECKNRVFELIHLPPLGGINHGHHIITFKYGFESCASNSLFTKEKFIYNKGKFDEMSEYFENINWCSEFQNMDANSSYERLLAMYHDGCRKFIPIIRLTNNQIKNGAIWMNDEIKSISKEKRRVWFE